MFYTKSGTVWVSWVNLDSFSVQLRKVLLRECLIEVDTSRTWTHFNQIGSKLIKNVLLGPDPNQTTMAFEAANSEVK